MILEKQGYLTAQRDLFTGLLGIDSLNPYGSLRQAVGDN